jgi:predicted 2-oxoglutarate/Fe(II)-dependent dioxygenase YbiX
MSEFSIKSECPCGSGALYFRCCGALDERHWTEIAPGRIPGHFSDPELSHFVANEPQCEYASLQLPPGLLVKDLDSSYEWRAIAEAMVNTPDDEEAKVKDKSGNTKTSNWRVTDIVDQGAHANSVTELVRRAYREEAEPFYKRQLKSLETPHILRYRVNSYYRPHADSDQLNPDTHRWEKIHDRDLSLLIYLDDDYEGGELAFPNFDFRLRPHAGMLVIFPSDCRYLHGAMPVTRGIRHAIVSWCALK